MRINLTKKDLVISVYMQVGFSKLISENLIDGRVNNFVKNLLTDDKKFKGMSKYCLEKSKKYDWVSTSEQLVDMYEGLI